MASIQPRSHLSPPHGARVAVHEDSFAPGRYDFAMRKNLVWGHKMHFYMENPEGSLARRPYMVRWEEGCFHEVDRPIMRTP